MSSKLFSVLEYCILPEADLDYLLLYSCFVHFYCSARIRRILCYFIAANNL